MLTTPNQLAAWSDLPKLQQLLETLEKIYQAPRKAHRRVALASRLLKYVSAALCRGIPDELLPLRPGSEDQKMPG